MARELHRLTPAEIGRHTKPGRLADGGGLILQRTPTGASWLFRYTREGKERWMGLGPLDAGRLAESLAAARAAAEDARRRLANGDDPIGHKKALAVAAGPTRQVTFAELAAEYIAAHRDDWKNPKKAVKHWQWTFDHYASPVIGKKPVHEIGFDDAIEILRPIWRVKPETARRVRARCENVLDFAVPRKLRTGENPFRLMLMKQQLGKRRAKVRNHASLPWEKIPELWKALGDRRDAASEALRWLMLTATRSNEGRFARHSEIDTRKATWTVPAHRMKEGEPHAVPLPPAALEIVKRLPKRDGDDFLFVAPGQKQPVSDTLLRDLLRSLGYTKDDVSLHGMRASFRDFCAEDGIPRDVAESALAHRIAEDDTEAAYLRTKLLNARRPVMLRWSQWATCDPAFFG